MVARRSARLGRLRLSRRRSRLSGQHGGKGLIRAAGIATVYQNRGFIVPNFSTLFQPLACMAIKAGVMWDPYTGCGNVRPTGYLTELLAWPAFGLLFALMGGLLVVGWIVRAVIHAAGW